MQCEVIDTMGSDLTVVNAARVSFAKESDWEWDSRESGYGGENVRLAKRDQKLIKYLADHNHWTPFSHVMITMREKVPIFVARQRFKHMVGFTYNEISRRYVDDKPEFFRPVWRERADNKKQGSGGEVSKAIMDLANSWIAEIHDLAERHYYNLLENGVAPEQARMILPQSMYTEYFVTGSLAAWARAYKLRIDAHSQVEIQELARKWNEQIMMYDEMEHSWAALTK